MTKTILMTAAFGLVILNSVMGEARADDASLARRTFTYKKVGELEIHADVYPASESVKRPVVAWYHGGALMMGSRSGVPKQLLDLCRQKNFVLVSFDYRLVPEAKLPAVIEDLKDGLKWLRASGPTLFNAAPDKIVVAGASAGGYLAMMSGIAIDPPPTAIVSYWGFGDIDGDWTTTPNEHYRKMGLVSEEDAWSVINDQTLTGTDKSNVGGRAKLFMYLKQNGLWAKVATGFDPSSQPQKLVPFCPIKNLTSKYPPILMLHGTADKDVPYEKSVEMAAELKRLQRPHKLITVENGGHSLWGGDPQKIQQAFKSSMEYIASQLSGTPNEVD